MKLLLLLMQGYKNYCYGFKETTYIIVNVV